MRRLTIAFWTFIAIMLLWQFYTYNQGLNEAAAAHPDQKQFFYYNTNTGSATPPPPAAPTDGPQVKQVRYWADNNNPGPGTFTSHVIVKNVGNAKAVAVQLLIRPYRGITVGDEDNGNSHAHKLSDDDPLSQMGQWVAFPDLAPNESSTQTMVFVARPLTDLGSNPDPDISFSKETAPASPAQPQPGAGH